MCKLFYEWENEIKSYCSNNNLDYSKVCQFPKSWGKSDIWIQFHDPQKGQNGLIDETPAPIVLKISKNKDKIMFEQTEHTRKYLT